MNKYTDLSDFEINKAVAEKHGYHWYWSNTVGKPPIMVNGYIFDPCNNPADAMPIIIENRISLRNRYEGDWKAETEWGMPFESINKNPLRAAMEVFLMMKDEENNND